jgi:hypothetical protein
MFPVDRGCARLDVSQRRVVRPEARGSGSRSEDQRCKGSACEELTCSGNWGLRRLLE